MKEHALRLVEMAAKNRKEAQRRFEEAIVRARDEGCTLREIEAVAGITNPTVLYYERRARARRE